MPTAWARKARATTPPFDQEGISHAKCSYHGEKRKIISFEGTFLNLEIKEANTGDKVSQVRTGRGGEKEGGEKMGGEQRVYKKAELYHTSHMNKLI